MFRISKGATTREIFDTIRQEIRSQYLLGFSPSNPAREGTFHKLKIRTKRKNLTVQGREGYYTFKSSER